MKSWFLFLLIFTIANSAWAEGVVPSANIVDLPQFDFNNGLPVLDRKKSFAPVEEEVLDYRSLTKELNKLHQDPNQIRADYQLELLAKEVVGKTFLFQDTIKVKRNALVTRELGLWFEPYPGVEVLLQMNVDHRREFAALTEFDFVVAKAVCKSLGKQCQFEMVSFEKMEPFDPSAEFVDYNLWMKKLETERGTKTFFEYKDYLRHQADEKHERLGYVTGIVQSLLRDKSGIYNMILLVNGNQLAEVACHGSYLEVLLNVQMKTRISMAVILDHADTRDGYFFKRGCMIRVKEE